MSQAFQFLLFVFHFVIFLAGTVVFASLTYISDKIFPRKNGRYSRFFVGLWGKTAVHSHLAYIKVINRPQKMPGPFVIISNHQSEVDIYVAAASFPVDFVFFSKEEVFRTPLIGSAMSAARHIPVNRENQKEAAKSIFLARDRLKQGISVLFYPEGTFSLDPRNFLPFKGGAFSIATKTKLPIFPIVIYGTKKLQDDERPFYLRKPGRILVKFLEPIDTDDPKHPLQCQTKQELEELISWYRSMMMEQYQQLATKDSKE